MIDFVLSYMLGMLLTHLFIKYVMGPTDMITEEGRDISTFSILAWPLFWVIGAWVMLTPDPEGDE